MMTLPNKAKTNSSELKRESKITGVEFQDFLPAANMFLRFIPLEKLEGANYRTGGIPFGPTSNCS